MGKVESRNEREAESGSGSVPHRLEEGMRQGQGCCSPEGVDEGKWPCQTMPGGHVWSDFSGVGWQEAQQQQHQHQHQKESRNGDKHQISLKRKTDERKRFYSPEEGDKGIRGMRLKANSNGHTISLLSDIECLTIVTREVHKFTPYGRPTGPHGIQFSGKKKRTSGPKRGILFQGYDFILPSNWFK